MEHVQKTCSAPTHTGYHRNILKRHSGWGNTNKIKTNVDTNKTDTRGHKIHRVTKCTSLGHHQHRYRFTHRNNHNNRSTYLASILEQTYSTQMSNYYHVTTYVWNRQTTQRFNNSTYSTSKTF